MDKRKEKKQFQSLITSNYDFMYNEQYSRSMNIMLDINKSFLSTVS